MILKKLFWSLLTVLDFCYDHTTCLPKKGFKINLCPPFSRSIYPWLKFKDIPSSRIQTIIGDCSNWIDGINLHDDQLNSFTSGYLRKVEARMAERVSISPLPRAISDLLAEVTISTAPGVQFMWWSSENLVIFPWASTISGTWYSSNITAVLNQNTRFILFRGRAPLFKLVL